MIRNNLSWINLNVGSSGGSDGGGVSDYNDLANRPIISMTGTSQNPLKLWNLSTGLYLLNGYVYYDTTNSRECINLFISITAQMQNGKYVLSAFVPSWEGHYEYIKANSTSTEYTDTQILKMLTENDVLTLTNEVEYAPTTDYHPSTKKYVDEAMQSVMEEFAKMGVNEQDIKTLIAENRRRDIAIQALLNETADKNVTIEEDTHTISLDYSMEDGMATVNSIEGSTLVNVSKTVDEVYVTKSQNRAEQSKVANTIGEQNGKLCPIIEGDTLVNVCDQKEPIAITKSYTVENSGNHIALQGEYDGKCRPVIQGNTLVNLVKKYLYNTPSLSCSDILTLNSNISLYSDNSNLNYRIKRFECSYILKPSTEYTLIYNIIENNNTYIKTLMRLSDGTELEDKNILPYLSFDSNAISFTTPSDKEIIGFAIFVDSNSNDEKVSKISNIMIFEGDLTQTPELIPTEYVEGLKSSFEDNLVTQEMVDSGEESAENLGKYKVEYKVTGKNKFDGVFKVGTIKNDGSYDDSWIGYMVTDYIKLKRNSQYYSKILYNNTQINMFIKPFYYDADFNYLGTDAEIMTTPIIRTLDIPFTYCILRYYIKDGGYDKTLLSNIQIEEGTVATEYEPYKSYTKTFYLNSPLLEGDTIEDINGVATHVKRYEKVVLDGSENWSAAAEVSGSVQCNYIRPQNMKSHATVLCDKLEVMPFGYYVDTQSVIKNDIAVVISLKNENLQSSNLSGFKQWLQANPTTVVYELASPIYETISTESILCDSYVNGHLDVDSAVPVEKVRFFAYNESLPYLKDNTQYNIQFEADSNGIITSIFLSALDNLRDITVTKGINKISLTTTTISTNNLWINGIGFNASNIVVTEATDKEFDYFNGIQSTFEENLVTDENNPHYGKYRVIYRTKSSDGNASTVKSVYLNSPLLQGDKLVVVNGNLCHYHKMGKVVLDGSENWFPYLQGAGIRILGKAIVHVSYLNIHCDKLKLVSDVGFREDETLFGITSMWNDILYIRNENTVKSLNEFKQWLQENPTTVVYELASPYYEEISSNPKDTVVDFYANGTLEVQSAVYPLSMEFTSFEEELTYLYASTVYTVQFEANGNAIANITLGGATVTNQEITHGLNRIQVTTPSTLIDNKLIIDGCGDCKISKVVVTNSIEEFDYFEGMKSAFEDKQNEDGTYTVEIVVYNAPIRLNKDKE